MPARRIAAVAATAAFGSAALAQATDEPGAQLLKATASLLWEKRRHC